jgi:hypothetical protein
MAVMKKSVRKKLSKYLERLIKKHGAEMTLALVTGIVSSIAADGRAKADRAEARRAAKEGKRSKAGKVEKADRAQPENAARPDRAARLDKVARPERVSTSDKAARMDLEAAEPGYREGGRRARGAGKRTER